MKARDIESEWKAYGYDLYVQKNLDTGRFWIHFHDGRKCYGPFNERNAALEYADKHIERFVD
jgi:hypothetical protein